MFRHPTVMVLGAGASAWCGLPTAAALKQSIIADRPVVCRASGSSIDSILRNEQKQAMDSLALSLRQSGQYSIDSFLEGRREFTEVGKRAIAQVLVPLENAAAMRAADNWYQWLFHRLYRKGVRGLSCGQLTIVTFNYDRTLELGLAQMLAHSTGMDVLEAWNSVQLLPIIHVYGKLSARVGRSPDGIFLRVDESVESVLASAKSIRIVGEERAPEPVDDAQSDAWDAVMAAQRVLFLGFSYDRTNLARIGIKGGDSDWAKRTGVSIHGTGMGMAHQERMTASSCIGHGAFIDHQDRDCHAYVRHYHD